MCTAGRSPRTPPPSPVFSTEDGRELRGGGGIFPDFEIGDDTLLVVERQFLEEVAAADFPFGLRLAEIGFDRARAVSNEDVEAVMTEPMLEDFIAELREAEVPEATLEDPVVRNYLLWRLEIALSQRMNDEGRTQRVRMERDPVLSEAVRLVREAADQAEIFRLAGGVT